MSLRNKLNRLGDPRMRAEGGAQTSALSTGDAQADHDRIDNDDSVLGTDRFDGSTQSKRDASDTNVDFSQSSTRDTLEKLRGVIRDLETKAFPSHVQRDTNVELARWAQLEEVSELRLLRENNLARVCAQHTADERYGAHSISAITEHPRAAFETLLRSQHEDAKRRKTRKQLADKTLLPDDFDFTRVLFLDTETTGLAGGTGTIPFLIGIAYFDAEKTLHVEQLLLEEPGRELPMLLRLRELLQRAQLIVSYNGKSFDWPLLRTRAVLHRVPLTLPAHLDLLFTTRRVFRSRLGSAKLIHIENEVLKHAREDDVHGAQIPKLFWEFVRSRDTRWVTKVVEHNRLDLVALPAIFGLICETLAAPSESVLVGEDHLGLAHVAERAESNAVLPLLEAALSSSNSGVRHDAHLFAARRHKQNGDLLKEEDGLLRALAEVASDEAKVALAKFYEHRKRDYGTALRFAQELCDTARIERLQRRLGNQTLFDT